MNTIKIGNKLIGEKQPCFIIGEAGVNHNGKLSIAKKLVDVAVDAGVDAVKFQTFTAETLVTKEASIAPYAQRAIGREMKQQQLIEKLELAYKDFRILKTYCDTKGIIFLSTPHSFDAIDFLEDIVPAYKFGSGDITNTPALQHAAKKGKPMVLGTGMATLQEIKHAVYSIRAKKNTQIILLHCTTSYPCPLEDVNLRAMLTLKNTLGCLVGYSDHSLGTLVPIMAVALGASVLEKHFTLDKKLPGPDHQASLEPRALKQMVTDIRNVETVLGSYEKKPTKSEMQIMKLVRKSIVANQDIKRGTTIKNHMLSIKRPGIGLKPDELKKIIGKKAKRSMVKDELLRLNMVE
jgi:N,N'-diacetyllegionaminate synthase